jgi:hypothetical protein
MRTQPGKPKLSQEGRGIFINIRSQEAVRSRGLPRVAEVRRDCVVNTMHVLFLKLFGLLLVQLAVEAGSLQDSTSTRYGNRAGSSDVR